MLKLTSSDFLQLEQLSERKKNMIIERYKDMREESFRLFIELWEKQNFVRESKSLEMLKPIIKTSLNERFTDRIVMCFLDFMKLEVGRDGFNVTFTNVSIFNDLLFIYMKEGNKM